MNTHGYWQLFGNIFRASGEADALDEVWDRTDPHRYGPRPRREDFAPADFGPVTEDAARLHSASRNLGWFGEPAWVTGGEEVDGALVYYVEGHPTCYDDGWYASVDGWAVLSGPYDTAEEAAADAYDPGEVVGEEEEWTGGPAALDLSTGKVVRPS